MGKDTGESGWGLEMTLKEWDPRVSVRATIFLEEPYLSTTPGLSVSSVQGPQWANPLPDGG